MQAGQVEADEVGRSRHEGFSKYGVLGNNFDRRCDDHQTVCTMPLRATSEAMASR